MRFAPEYVGKGIALYVRRSVWAYICSLAYAFSSRSHNEVTTRTFSAMHVFHHNIVCDPNTFELKVSHFRYHFHSGGPLRWRAVWQIMKVQIVVGGKDFLNT